MGGLNVVPYMQKLHRAGVVVTPMTRVSRLRREGNKLAVTLWSPYAEADCGERLVDQVVVEQATMPLDELYFALKEESINRGEVDYEALVEGRPQSVSVNGEGRFRLYRIGDAVAARNVHAAVYDALRLCKDL
jgi:N-methyl-L-proline demethylase